MLLQARPPCVGDDDKLSDVLHRLDEPSLSKLIRDHEEGKLDEICKTQRDRLGVGRWRSLTGFTYWGTLLVLPSLSQDDRSLTRLAQLAWHLGTGPPNSGRALQTSHTLPALALLPYVPRGNNGLIELSTTEGTDRFGRC